MTLEIEYVTEVAREFARKNGYSTARLESVEEVSKGTWKVVLDPMVLILGPGFLLEVTIREVAMEGKVVGFKKIPT